MAAPGALGCLQALALLGPEVATLQAVSIERRLSGVEREGLAELCILLEVLGEVQLTAEDIRVLAGYCFEEGQGESTLRIVLQGSGRVLDGDLRDVAAKCGGWRGFGVLVAGFREGLRFAAGDGEREDGQA